MNKMNPKVKEQWIAALESGNYQHGQNHLCQVNDGVTKHCCLGVLTDLYLKETGIGYWQKYEDGTLYFILPNKLPERAYLPKEVADWADIDYQGALKEPIETQEDFKYDLAEINDDYQTEDFSSIINIIKAQF